MTWTLVVLVVLLVVLLGFFLSWRASRLDRLHGRLDAARAALDLALVRRSSAASELASSGLLDPASSLLLADAALRARKAGPGERDLPESDLTRSLRATLDKEVLDETDLPGELIDEVRLAARQVYIARKFYNDVAGRTIDDRSRFLVRTLHLYGHAKQPQFFDMDDEL